MEGLPMEQRPSSVIHVLIVDDHPMVRVGLRELIERESDLAVCGVAASAAEALGAVAELDPDLVLLDLSLGDSDGTQVIREIRARSERARVLVLSTYEESTYARRSLRAGAHGYLNKRAAADEVRHAIRVVAGGEVFVSEEGHLKDTGSELDPRGTAPPNKGLEVLSDRELEVFQFLGRGYGPSRIAELMNLSVKTVESYEARMRQKLGLADTRGLSAFAVEYYRGPGR